MSSLVKNLQWLLTAFKTKLKPRIWVQTAPPPPSSCLVSFHHFPLCSSPLPSLAFLTHTALTPALWTCCSRLGWGNDPPHHHPSLHTAGLSLRMQLKCHFLEQAFRDPQNNPVPPFFTILLSVSVMDLSLVDISPFKFSLAFHLSFPSIRM